ncbi:hypothetical protein ANTRET_LOCUS8877 [Anthophora retusa]
MSGPKFETFDVSERVRKVIEWRHARRLALRHEYLKESLKPVKQKLITDNALERYTAVRLFSEFHVKVTAKGVGLYAAAVFGTLATLITLAKKVKDNEEHMYRTGQVSYGDRFGKFV